MSAAKKALDLDLLLNSQIQKPRKFCNLELRHNSNASQCYKLNREMFLPWSSHTDEVTSSALHSEKKKHAHE